MVSHDMAITLEQGSTVQLFCPKYHDIIPAVFSWQVRSFTVLSSALLCLVPWLGQLETRLSWNFLPEHLYTAFPEQ